MNLAEKVDLTKLVIRHATKHYGRVFAACSFGKDSRVLVDLAMQVDRSILFVGVDTGYEFSETLGFADSLVAETGMNFVWTRPPEEDRLRIETAFGDSLVRDDRYKCCEMKRPALAPVFARHDAWITGLRRDENQFRSNTPVVERASPVKINALAFWTREDVWRYITDRGLRYHPLYDAGYASLGCRPCTRPGGDSERGGRFAGTTHVGQECGLHLAS
jgi:phosphoadenosine phosphosulfate reductase